MRRYLTEVDAIADFAAQGLKYKRIRGGYVVTGPAGTFRWRNAGVIDQIVYRGGLGFLNVSPVIRRIAQDKPKPRRLPLDESVSHHIKLYDIDAEHVRGMPTERRDEPVILLMTETGPVLIDGAHRLNRRLLDGCTEYEAFVLAPQTVEWMSVAIEQRMPNGAWVPQDPRSLSPVQELYRAASHSPQI